MPMTPSKLMNLWQRILTLSQVKAGETVVVVDTFHRDNLYKSVAMTSAELLGASVSYLEVPGRTNLPNGALALLKAADLIIDLAFILDGRIRDCRQGGTRVLVVLEPPEILERMLPTLEDKQRAVGVRDRISRAKTLHVTSAAGTDFYAELGEFPGMCQYGFADEPGHWDQWPGAFAFTFPTEGSAHGTLILDSGDIIFPFFSYIQEPITLRLEGGYIRDISGGFDADYMRAFMARYQDPEVYAVSHIGWGLSHNGHWSTMGMYGKGQTEGQDGRAFAGNFLFSTGPNSVGGGSRTTPCHLDIPMRFCSVYLDDEPVVIDGNLVAQEQPAASVLA